MSRDREMGLRTVPLALASLMLLILVVPSVYAMPETDVLRFLVVLGPGDKLVAMVTDTADIWPSYSNAMDLSPVPEAQADSLMEVDDIEDLDNVWGFTILQDPAFHVGFIGFNIRDTATINVIRAIRGLAPVSYWPLQDVEVRHALIHAYDQSGIINTNYDYVVTPVRSLVPPAQSKYYNPFVQKHPFNQGDPFVSSAGEHSSVGILLAAGYTFVDAGIIGSVDAADYWNMPNGDPLPKMELWTPFFGIAPQSFMHGANFVWDLGEIGLEATVANGLSGFVNVGRDLNAYLGDVYGTPGMPGGFFDAFMGFTSFGRLPDQLYTSYYSGQDTQLNWFGGNAVGMNDATVDSLVETVEYSLDPDEIEVAAKQVQERLYDPTLPNADNFALAYMYLYSKYHFSAYDPNLEGIVKSPGYGTDNKWTYLNINWKPGLEKFEPDGVSTVVESILDDDPDSFNPLSATTNSEWEILEQVYDGLTNINPYNHNDIPWIATDWSIVETAGGMNIDYTILPGVMWQDGILLTPGDIEWGLEFMRDRNVQRYSKTLQTLVDVVLDPLAPLDFTIISNEASLNLFYDFNGLATLLPPQVWDQPWPSDLAVQMYDPTVPYAVAPGYVPGPAPPPTNLFGTGPWIFQFFVPPGGPADLKANGMHFLAIPAMLALLTDMFWEVGDQDKSGKINAVDLSNVGIDIFQSVPPASADSDFNMDGYIDMRDLTTSAFHLNWQKEYP